jgi:hypothetical protein
MMTSESEFDADAEKKARAALLKGWCWYFPQRFSFRF